MRCVLRPCKYRSGKLVPASRQESVVFDAWPKLCERLVERGDTSGPIKLRMLVPGSYVGKIRSRTTEGRVVSFFLNNRNRSGDVEWILKTDPTFEMRLVEIFRCEEISWDGKVMEHENA